MMLALQIAGGVLLAYLALRAVTFIPDLIAYLLEPSAENTMSLTPAELRYERSAQGGFTVAEYADLLGITAEALEAYESGRRLIPPQVRAKVLWQAIDHDKARRMIRSTEEEEDEPEHRSRRP